MAIAVPSSDASWDTISTFALTYNGYGRHQSAQSVAEIGNSTLASWRDSRFLPDDIDTLRCALFFEQRRWRHFGEHPDAAAFEYLVAVLERLRALTGGLIPGIPDDLP